MGKLGNVNDKCPVCGEDLKVTLYKIGEGRLLKCSECSLVTYFPRPTAQELSDYYNSEDYWRSYEESPMGGDAFSIQRYDVLKELIRRIVPGLLRKKDRCMLDVGCGYGGLLTVAEKDGWKTAGIEYAQSATKKAKSRIIGRVYNTQLPCSSLESNQFDLVTIYHVIEHLSDPLTTLLEINRVLRPGGILVLETPNIGSLGSIIMRDGWSHLIPPEHLTYFNRRSIRVALDKSNYRSVKVFTIAPPIVESLSGFSWPVRMLGRSIYRVAPYVSLGAALQVVAFKGAE